MKSIAITLAITLFCRSFLSAQCPADITFTTQAQLDSFPVNYPVCTNITGNVFIFGPQITSLDGLQQIDSIGGNLDIQNAKALLQLNGLNQLQAIGGNLNIDNNDSLLQLNGLNQLRTIGGDLGIYGNLALTQLNGLNQLRTVGAMQTCFSTP